MPIEWLDRINHPADLAEFNRAELFGDGFFTTGVIRNGALEFRQQHIQRIELSIKRLKFYSLSLQAINQAIDQACLKSANAVLRINVIRQQIPRGYAISPTANSKIQMILSPIPGTQKQPCDLLDAKTQASANSSLAGLKHLNRLDSVLAASELSSPEEEALMYHQDMLISGSKSNIFVMVNGDWLTPSLNLCGVTGIMRNQIIQQMSAKGLSCREEEIPRNRLSDVTAAFVSNCIIGIWPAASVNSRALDLEASQRLREQLDL